MNILTSNEIREFCKNRGEINRFVKIISTDKNYYAMLKSGNWYNVFINTELQAFTRA